DQQRVLNLGVDGLITNWPACTLAIQGRAFPERLMPSSVHGSQGIQLGACPANPPPSTARARPSEATCQALRPAGFVPATGYSDPDGALRVFAIQYKQQLSNVKSYASFRTAMRCLMEDFVVP